MKLLICTQAVDLDDPVLGFFHRWIAEFSKRCESVQVICLREGRHDLPANVSVHSLGKESGSSRIGYVLRFYRFIWSFRREYDAVFVHMNPEYVVLGGVWWKLWRKRVSLWRNHYAPSKQADAAALFCDVMFSTSRNSYLVKYKKTRLMPVGIDTGFFSPQGTPRPRSLLFLGRLDPTKRVETFVRAIERLHGEGVDFSADIVGSPSGSHQQYAHDVRNLAALLSLDGSLTMRPAVTNDAARDIFRSHEIYCNLSPQGHFDKTILEAAASGCIVVATNQDMRAVLPDTLIPEVDDPDSAARALEFALKMPRDERRQLTHALRTWIEREHSLSSLIPKILGPLGR